MARLSKAKKDDLASQFAMAVFLEKQNTIEKRIAEVREAFQNGQEEAVPIAERYYRRLISAEFETMLRNLPQGTVKWVDELDGINQCEGVARYAEYFRDENGEKVKKPIPHRLKFTDSEGTTHWMDLTSSWACYKVIYRDWAQEEYEASGLPDLETLRDKLHTAQHQLRTNLRNKLESVTSAKMLADAWPEGYDFATINEIILPPNTLPAVAREEFVNAVNEARTYEPEEAIQLEEAARQASIQQTRVENGMVEADAVEDTISL